MKSFVALACILAFTAAEPPPNSYLPPSPSPVARSTPSAGYQSGAPQVAVARSQGANFGRTPAAAQGYDQNANAFGRNGLEGGFGGEPAHYNFGYSVNDHDSGTDFGHHEVRDDERAHGEYHVVLPDGRKQTVNYEADERGFKPRVSYQGGAGGYDAAAGNNFGARNGGY